jgi:hypothetical protein
VPVDAVVKPGSVPVVDGAVHPTGTATVTAPLFMPPVAAVYVKVIVFPVEVAKTDDVGVVNVPEPSAELVTVIDGDDARLVRVPPLLAFSCACQVCGPVVDVAVAPDPPDVVLPYTIVSVPPLDSVTPDTVIV